MVIGYLKVEIDATSFFRTFSIILRWPRDLSKGFSILGYMDWVVIFLKFSVSSRYLPILDILYLLKLAI